MERVILKKTKFSVVFLVTALLAVVITTWWSIGLKGRAQQVTAPEGSIRWFAQQAAAQGKDNIAVQTDVYYHEPVDLNDAIASDSVVVGQLINIGTSWDDTTGEITTWYKFNISETLAQRAYGACSECTVPSIPAELLPVSAGQLVVPMPGGSALIDSVVVSEELPQFPGLVTGQTYLLFLNVDSSSGIGHLDYGPMGALLVSGDNFAPVLQLIEGQGDSISSGLMSQYSNSLSSLRQALNPPGPGCNQAGQQSCIDDGGTWNSSNCSCTPAFDLCTRKPWLCE